MQTNVYTNSTITPLKPREQGLEWGSKGRRDLRQLLAQSKLGLGEISQVDHHQQVLSGGGEESIKKIIEQCYPGEHMTNEHNVMYYSD